MLRSLPECSPGCPGALLLVAQPLRANWSALGWPLFVVVPGLALFATFFEAVLNLSGLASGSLVRYALPGVLVVAGVVLIVLRESRRPADGGAPAE